MKEFNELKLNIKLEKCSGYDSKIDIYSFKSDFLQLYAKSTPVSLQSDLLINNFLSEPAFSLVKGVNNINEVWERLINAYGDTKLLLTKKLKSIQSHDIISKSKDPEKIASSLTKLTNALRDLIKLAETHKIENRLYYSDALENIYKIIGEAQFTRWLSNCYEEKCSFSNKKP